MAENDEHALQIARNIVSTLSKDKYNNGSFLSPEPPKYEKDSLYGIIPPSLSIPYDVHEVIARIVDGSKFTEFKSLLDHRW